MSTLFVIKVRRTVVNFEVCESDLPESYWPELISDVTAVVSQNAVKRVLWVKVCVADFYPTRDDPELDPESTMGLTEGRHLNRIHINPNLYVRESEYTDGLSNNPAWDDFHMPSATNDYSRFVFAHEYGHSVLMPRIVRNGFPDALFLIGLMDDGAMSVYSKSSPEEAIAEAYAEWFMTNGETHNQWAIDTATLLHFPKGRVKA